MSKNHLSAEKSLYLKQHAENPIHWYPYGQEAIEKSKNENKPIFLSIGYSSCHWCHVMAHESFENQETAKFLNENFVCIKVDREEYPDLDQYYQLASQLYTGSGGWPLSAFLTTDLKPYFVGTYFPPKRTSDRGTPSFMEMLSELSRAYQENPDQVNENADNITEKIKDGLIPSDEVQYSGHFPAPEAIIDALNQYQDNTWGGYGQAPKFPNFSFYEYALEQMLEGMIPKEKGEHIVKTLEHMLLGGISDHARGGIHRYSVDDQWLVPHFEKMLYDQAGYLKTLSKLGLLYPSALVFDALNNTLDYLSSEMLSEEKYFFSAQDADSEGHEGLYFTYSLEEFEELLKENEELSKRKDDIVKWLGLKTEGNFEQGLNVISLDPGQIEEYMKPENWDIIREVRALISEDRRKRIPPQTDTKGVASWNFMILSALVDVVQYCPVQVIKVKAFQMINENLEGIFNSFLVKKEEQKLRIKHVTTLDHKIPYFEDYVFFAETQLRLYEMTGNAVFRKNFQESMEEIERAFLNDNKIFTRPTALSESFSHPNAELDCFDSSFKSPLSTYIGLIRKASLLWEELEYEQKFSELIKTWKNHCLKNPLACGEALRSFVYPIEAYRKVKFPASWVDQEKFQQFKAYFLPRFIFEAQSTDSDKWQVCRHQTCELEGEGLEFFLKSLIPQADHEEA
ncbi:MAG: thioredoxin domain-containing protein [Bacteriovoracaceae bacterium]